MSRVQNTYLYLLFLGFTPAQIVALQTSQSSNNGVAVVCSGSGSVSCNQQNVCCNGSHFSGVCYSLDYSTVGWILISSIQLNVQACNAVNVS